MDPAQPAAPHRWGLGAFFVVEAVYLVSALALAVVLGRADVSSVLPVAVGVALPTALAAGCAVVVTTLRGNGPRTDLCIRWSWRGTGVGVLFGGAGLLVTIPASVLWLSIVGEDVTSAADDVFGDLRSTWGWAVLVFAVVVVVAPVCEEIIFRGLLWGAVEQRWGRWVALGVTTVVFAIAHLEWQRAPLLLVIGLPIGLARLYGGTLVASIVAHAIANLLPGLVLMFTVAGVMPAA
ncbi:CPBP family intramembrane metalloprotease [Mycolicibacterium chubuense]|uniref:CAAX amino terminal protease self-immunity n=1 Tax=Mycolicibacterium chubuense TaxID=1800 RepID=A0A0J6WNI5_MYCCU|nr:type II CAAX endopeptidase family protein [Mycolicibacterium chubuense]KMO83252.1 CAAX amino terminal protease self- immunity [Mycolicibacterium chubuense]ORA43160.1 CPBP family intramembrane metalloprotease [Mycolicibacterium chubuense]SPX96173.1 putative integral membrane protein [Mycolicibacterium chubuense]